MKQCKECEFYNEDYDKMEQSDTEPVESEQKEQHFCPLFPDGIPDEIIKDRTQCEFCVKRK